jgi:hypothetical protein
MKTTTTRVEPGTTVWRCGGVVCPPGTCDHDDEPVQRHATGAATGAIPATRHRISTAGEPAEVEADRVADAIMAGAPVPATLLTAGGNALQRKGAIDLSGVPWENELEVQRSPAPTSTEAARPGADIDAGIRAMSGTGRPLEPSAREFLESRFGHRFEEVRIHTDQRSADVSRSIGARAFTVGHDIAFAPGEYQPSTTAGRRLLAHELTHVVQQARMRPHVSDDVQRDLATEPPAGPVEDQPDLTDAQITAAIAFNRARYNEANTRLIQDLLGGPITGTWTRENIIAIAATQEEYGLKADGKVGSETFRFLNNEQRLEGMSTADENCLTAFQVSVGAVRFIGTNPASITANFRTASEFSSRCRCSAFQYRQFIRGHARHIRGAVTTDISNVFAAIPGGRLPVNFVEDGDTTDNPVNYGHRNQPADNNPEDHYINDRGADDQANGCRYRNDDTPGLQGITPTTGDVFDLNINFRGEIQRNGRVVQTRRWTAINGRFTMP